jgi:RNA polymerase sigma-70 factor (ECF subfamily)
VILHDLEGFTHEEIAQALQIEPGTAKSQLSRARRALRALAGQSSLDRGRTA